MCSFLSVDLYGFNGLSYSISVLFHLLVELLDHTYVHKSLFHLQLFDSSTICRLQTISFCSLVFFFGDWAQAFLASPFILYTLQSMYQVFQPPQVAILTIAFLPGNVMAQHLALW